MDLVGGYLAGCALPFNSMGGVMQCNWKYDDIHDTYDTACGESYWFECHESDLRSISYKYCPNCGKPINEIKVIGDESFTEGN